MTDKPRHRPIDVEFFQTIRASGKGETHTVPLNGPMSLYRFGRVNFGEPQCWFDEVLYQAARGKALRESEAGGVYGDAFRQVVREACAVSIDWNDFAIFNAMHLPGDVTIWAFESRIAPQPYLQDKSFREAGRPVPSGMRQLKGGARQFWLFPIPGWTATTPNFVKRDIGT